MMDPQAKKTALRMVSYGLYVVTSATADDRSAFLCNWLTQSSFEPPLIVVAVENEAHSLKVMRAAGRFAVCVLETGQRELAGWFGRHSDKVGDKLANRELMATPSGLPLCRRRWPGGNARLRPSRRRAIISSCWPRSSTPASSAKARRCS